MLGEINLQEPEYLTAIRNASRGHLEEVKQYLPQGIELLVDENPRDDLKLAGKDHFLIDFFSYVFSIQPIHLEKKVAMKLAEEAVARKASVIRITSDDIYFHLFSCIGHVEFYRMPPSRHDDFASY